MTNKYLLRLTVLALLCFWVFSVLCPAPAQAGEHRTISAQLRHSTQRWHQTWRSDGKISGCGNTAWAIVFAYWKQYKGKRNLLPGINLPHQQSGRNDALIAPLNEEIGNLTETTFGVYQGNKWGRTLGGNMCKAQKYVRNKGYRTSCSRIKGTEFNKFDHVKRMLDQDKPVIIMTNDPKNVFTTLHYPVIERAAKIQEKVAGKWRDRTVRYYVNMGHGGNADWIWVREKGRNQHKRTGSFSMFLLDIDPAQGSTGSNRDANLAACQDWCRKNGGCSQCSRLPGCGAGHKTVKAFTGAGRNWYACKKRPSYSDASRRNEEECKDWCEDNDSCDKCSKKPGCGVGYKKIKTFGGRGKNWYGCRKR